ncbi:MAG: MHS family MFS transporter [Candidatus Hydrogenedentes bacterium]|nr:MHS family MFS transporter [Candidatus Hydrogenedentota bacterium]
MYDQPDPAKPRNSTKHVLFGSLIGTAIEFFDFYIYANAAVLVFPELFFPASSETAGMLESLATFAIAFFARPVGSALFGHFGDRVGRKATLVAALLTMGVSTVAIGLLPTYASVGVAAPLLLAVCRMGQGLGLGGEWGGAVLLAIENAPPGRRAWYGMFPQLGAPIGFILSGGLFLILSETLTDEQFFSFGWRIPFLSSIILIVIGLYVRLKITETPVFEDVLKNDTRVRIPTATVVTRHTRAFVLGVLIAITTFALFYLLTVFTQSWGTKQLGYSRPEFLRLQLVAVLFFGATIPISAVLADRLGRRSVLIGATVAIGLFGFLIAPMFRAGSPMLTLCFLSLGLALMGATYGPLGTILSELFPPEVRFTGASLTFNLAGIFGGSLAPFFAVTLANTYGLASVGLYLTSAAMLTLAGLLLTHETRK